MKISATTLLKRIIEVSKNITQPPIKKGEIYEMDELNTFIKRKDKRIWIVYSLEQKSKRVVSFAVGNRSNATLSKVISAAQSYKLCIDKNKPTAKAAIYI